MRRSNQSVFNEYVPQGTINTASAYTSTELHAKLGHFDQLAIQVIIDNVTGSGGFDLYIEHSADGRNFVTTKSVATPPPVGSGDVSITALTASAVNLDFGFNNGTTPFLGYVRFRMFFSNGTTAAHVRVFVTQRDQGG